MSNNPHKGATYQSKPVTIEDIEQSRRDSLSRKPDYNQPIIVSPATYQHLKKLGIVKD